MMRGVPTYDEVLAHNLLAYGGRVEERAGAGIDEPWRLAEHEAFLGRMQAEGRRTLLEIGAGTGRSGVWFAQRGIDVLCTDASPAMVEHCRSLGLRAEVQDFLSLAVETPVEAVFSFNNLLHVPLADLPPVLGSVERCLEPGGLFFWGQYGGIRKEGPMDSDPYEPKRFFSSQTDDELLATASARFDIVDFRRVDLGWTDGAGFQALTLRRPPAPSSARS
jgi:SAM-dependent methyltransferase